MGIIVKREMERINYFEKLPDDIFQHMVKFLCSPNMVDFPRQIPILNKRAKFLTTNFTQKCLQNTCFVTLKHPSMKPKHLSFSMYDKCHLKFPNSWKDEFDQLNFLQGMIEHVDFEKINLILDKEMVPGLFETSFDTEEDLVGTGDVPHCSLGVAY